MAEQPSQSMEFQEKEELKERLKHTENMFRKNLLLKRVY